MRSKQQDLSFGVVNVPTNTKFGWRVVRFGEVVLNVDVNEHNPLEKGIERYIGLEHIDPESLHIKRWGLIKDGISFTRMFKKGQVLFGKRRAYQGKVAVAEFDGICSGDILVFEPKNDQLIPELLPFIVQSKGFFNHALGTSAGSLSPRTKWKDLAAYEFALPPRNEQIKISNILWEVEKLGHCYSIVMRDIEKLKAIMLESAISSTMNSNNLQQVTLDRVLIDTQYGTSKPSGVKITDGIPILRIPNILKGSLDLTDINWVQLTAEEKERYKVHTGDILLVRTNGNPAYVARSVAIKTVPKDTVFASYLIRLQVNKELIIPEYLNALLNSEYLRRTLGHEIRSSAGNYNINTQGLKKQIIPLLSLDEQTQLLKKLEAIDDAIEQLFSKIDKSKCLKQSLLSHLFNGNIEEGIDVQRS